MNSHARKLSNSSTHALFLSVSKPTVEMEPGRAAIVSLVELTIDFLLSIINGVLTTKQPEKHSLSHTHMGVHPHTCIDLDFVQCKMCFVRGSAALWGKAQVKY